MGQNKRTHELFMHKAPSEKEMAAAISSIECLPTYRHGDKISILYPAILPVKERLKYAYANAYYRGKKLMFHIGFTAKCCAISVKTCAHVCSLFYIRHYGTRFPAWLVGTFIHELKCALIYRRVSFLDARSRFRRISRYYGGS